MDPKIIALTKAIALTESANNGLPNYGAKGASGEKGAYQWMPGNFEAAAKSAGLDPTDFSPTNQNKVAYHQVSSLVSKGYKPYEVASEWNSGSPDNWQNHSGVNSQGVAYDTPGYVKRVQLNYQKVAGQVGLTTTPSNPNPIAANPVDPSTWGLSPLESDSMTIGANNLVTPEQYALQQAQKTGALLPAETAHSAPMGGSAADYGTAVGANILDTLKVVPNILSSGWNAGKGLINSILHPIQTAENIAADPLSLIPEAYKQLAGGIIAAGGDILHGNGWQATADALSALDKARVSFVDDPVGNYLLGKGLEGGVKGTLDIAKDPLGKDPGSLVGKTKTAISDTTDAIGHPIKTIQGTFTKIGNMFKSRGIQGMTEAVQKETDLKTANLQKLADLKSTYASLDKKLEYAANIKSQIDATQKAVDASNAKLDAFANTAAAGVKDIVTSKGFKDSTAIAATLTDYFKQSKDHTDAAYSAALRSANGEGTPLTFTAHGDLIDSIKAATETMNKESAGDPAVAAHMANMLDELKSQVEKKNVDANNIQTFYNRWANNLPQGLDAKTQAAFYGIKEAVYKAQEATMKATDKGHLVGDLQKTRTQYGTVTKSGTAALVEKYAADPEKLFTELTKPANWAEAQKVLGPQIIAHLQNSITSRILADAKNEDGTFNAKAIQKGIDKYGAALKDDHHGMLNENMKALNLAKGVDKLGADAADIVNKVGSIKTIQGLTNLADATDLTPRDLGNSYMTQAIQKAYTDTSLTTDSARLESFLKDFDKVGKGSTNSVAIKEAVFGKETVAMIDSIRDPKTGELAAFKEIEGYSKKSVMARVSNAMAAGVFAVLHHGLIAAGFAVKAFGPERDLPIAKTFLPEKSGTILPVKQAAQTAATAGAAVNQQHNK